MTTTARKALDDLKVAHHLLEIEEDQVKFRVLWVSAIALSRAVGHVLHKIDGPSSIALENAISAAYSTWKQQNEGNEIFKNFIEDERNSVLKEYEFGFLSASVELAVLPCNSIFELSKNLFCPINQGPYEGEDCRDVLALAINWWEEKLTEIECVVDASKHD
ncbi:hypothetical protein MHM89_17055 [Pseudoalteromonas sp. CNC9-20]|uniref:hypothetical protein n=1 Tax=Pseudoalteromonas sp. CNC9-20 TaxID=2917750 RepID=UPI001EF6C9EB|nr:hypothetical protein [Pseudoalteromonas sp. CNC9-20]MCG7571609.1 hypothetical protein [Pseudoalteromonas sp. CNC9-20]